ncbi:Rib/alpha-like domain-containing protein [Eubacteriales bacterium KG127]
MKKRTLKNKIGTMLLAVTVIATSFPAFTAPVHGADISKEQFATVDELKAFNTDDTDGEKSSAKVYFGNQSHRWWIAGSQNDNLTLFAASPLKKSEKFEPDTDNIRKPYQEEWGCTYPKGAPKEVTPNHWGASPIRKTLQDLETSYFTSDEQKLMKNTTVYTSDILNEYAVYSTTDKLYLPYGDNWNSGNQKYMTVGENKADNSFLLNKGLRIDHGYWSDEGSWLRTPNHSSVTGVAVVLKNPVGLQFRPSKYTYDIVPAFELDLSSVIFGSAAPAATKEGKLELKAVDKDGAFTLRYKKEDLGSAQVSSDKKSVKLSDVPKDTYLVVQNNGGAFAKKIDKESIVSAKDMGIDNFENSKVWLEKTGEDRISYGKLAVNSTLSTLYTPQEQPVLETEKGKEAKSQPIKFVNADSQDENPLDAPEGTIFKFSENKDLPKGITIDSKTGVISVSKDVPVGEYDVHIRIEYKDSSSNGIALGVNVKEPKYDGPQWKQEKDGSWYVEEKGVKKSGWFEDKDKYPGWYYFDKDGKMQTGWLQLGDTWYYLKSSGAMATDWEQIGSTWYYLKSSGAMATGWEQIGSTWYYLKSSGAMATGWEQIGSTWYYLKSSGAMATGWEQIGSTWYYLKSSGAMATGWEQIGSTWYYFASGGAWIR